ncbi:MAG: hypothetical protein NZM25_11440 [Leptospiraceae bacterium]|nr:hypothetical protein [Leptospiraceae bacterium]MDW8307449.1 hypothetical protein [Leptospiraceae bacterium]
MKRLFWAICFYSVTLPLLPEEDTSEMAVMPLLDSVHTATAITLSRGEYVTSFWAYHNGGILSKAQLGLNNNLYLGVSFDVENVIGRDSMRMNIPGVIAKWKLTEGWAQFPLLIAIGYDAFSTGSSAKLPEGALFNPWNRVLYGPYFVITKPIYLFGEEQYLHAGVRTPVQPYYIPEDTSAYFAFAIPLGYFTPIFELERVFFHHKRWQEMAFNLAFRLGFVPNLILELDILSQWKTRSSRMVVLEYRNQF